MSSEDPNAPPGPAPRRSSLGGFLKRMKSVLKKTKSSPDLSASSAIEHPVDPSTVAPQAIDSQPSVAPSMDSPTADSPRPEPATVDPIAVTVDDDEAFMEPQVIQIEDVSTDQLVSHYKVTRQQMWEERARQILERYDMIMEPPSHPTGDIVEPGTLVERVRKPIRMRVHRHCHRCERVFGPERVCVGCEHRRCKKCPRYPRDKADNARDDSRPHERKNKGRREEQHVMSREPLLVIRNPRTGGHILVHNRIVQHVRRACHKCQTEFTPQTSKMCVECGHARCAQCTGLVPKPDKWAQSFAGDAEISSEEENLLRPTKQLRQDRVFRKPRQRVRWNCDQCSTLFLEGQRTCRQCGHEKCDNCRRHPPKKTRQDYDPEIVRTLNEKLSALVMTTSAS